MTPSISQLRDENASLRAELLEVKAACARMRVALETQDPRNATARFERIAADFQSATGLMAPGKDVSPYANISDEDEERRRKLWRPFINKWHEDFFDAALKSSAGTSILALLRECKEALGRLVDAHAAGSDSTEKARESFAAEEEARDAHSHLKALLDGGGA